MGLGNRFRRSWRSSTLENSIFSSGGSFGGFFLVMGYWLFGFGLGGLFVRLVRRCSRCRRPWGGRGLVLLLFGRDC